MGQQINTPNDPEPQIRKLAVLIKEFMPRYPPHGWVPWSRISREMYGTVEFVDVSIGLAQLPVWRHLFVSTSTVVKLSGDGILFAEAQHAEGRTEVQRIADGVTRYAARLDKIWLRVEHISRVARVGKKFVHAVHVELIEEIIPSETPVDFQPQDGSATHGKVVGQEPDAGVLYIANNSEIFDADLPARLKIDRGFLLYQLAQQIEGLPGLPPRIKPIFHNDRATDISVADQNSMNVAKRLAHLQTPWTRILWGPPGAGKTFVLTNLIMRLLETEPHGQILLIAPSNRAVDVAFEQFVSQIENSQASEIIKQRKTLRFGYPRKAQIIERPELLGPVQLDELNHRAKTLSSQISKAEHEKSSSADTAILRAEMLAVQEEVKNAVEAHVRNCLVVATTATLAYLPSSPISSIKWNTVLIDEVTMVTPAMCTYLSSLSVKRLLMAGDPRQLGPVYEQSPRASLEDYEWMGRDIFDKGGLSSGEGEERRIVTDDVRLARITSQRRCAPEIWSRVERLYPEVVNLTVAEELQRLIGLPPRSGRSIALLDTSNSNELAKCEKFHGSWQNQYTAELAMEIACTIAAEAKRKISIAIISPYRAQIRLLRKWIREEQRAEITPYNKIEFESGTVHQFQGSDADVVIFDMVDGAGRSGLGKLLKGDTGVRLVNVAITRAKGKLIVLADKKWCGAAFNRIENPILWDLIMERSMPEQIMVFPPPNIDNDERKGVLESPIEMKLFEAIQKHHSFSNVIPQHVIRDEIQHPISRADFAFPEIKYAIYCDGKQWHLKEDRWQKDWKQRNKLTELGWIFSVFTGSEINRNPNKCVAQMAKTYQSRSDSMKQQS